MSKKKIIVHDSGFHADDVFAVATLLLHLGNENVEITRSRNPEIIETGDYIVDVGLIYDEEKNLFDHHQKGGAGERENGIPYASFGLVWKKFGKELCGSEEAARMLDEIVVQPIDAVDNGVDICKEVFVDIKFYGVDEIVHSFEPTWKESEDDLDTRFLNAVSFAKNVLKREIKKIVDEVEAQNNIRNIYSNLEDKKIIILEKEHKYGRFLSTYTLSEFPEPVYYVHYRKKPNEKTPTDWQVVAVTASKNSLELRKPFPESWAGLTGKDLVSITGVEDAYLCHKGAFMCLAGSKEGAIKLAKLALES